MRIFQSAARTRALAVLLFATFAASACQSTKISIKNENENTNVNGPTGPGTVPTPAVPTRLRLSPGDDQLLTRRVNPATGVCEATLQFTLEVEPAGVSRDVTYHLSADGGGVFTFSNLLFRAIRDTESPLPSYIQVWVRSTVNGLNSNAVTIRVRDECPPGTENPTPSPTPTPTPTPGPTLDLTAVPPSITSGGSSDLHFTSTNTLYCRWNDTNQMVGTSGTRRVSPTQTTDYPMTCRGVNGTDITKSVRVTVTSSQPSVCTVSSIDYTPAGGQIGTNQNIRLTAVPQGNWQEKCMVVWLTDRPSVLKILGADTVIQICSGGICNWYYAGLHGTVSGGAPGSAQGIARVIANDNGNWTMTGVQKSYTWNVVQALKALGIEWPNAPAPQVTDKTFSDRRICQTWQCRGDQ